MSEADRNLIEEAWGVAPGEYYQIQSLVPRAESTEAKRELWNIHSRKRHEDEYGVGLL